MGLFKKLKPKLVKFSVDKLKSDNLLYYCKTSLIDKIILHRAGKVFSQGFADAFESNTRHYFVVKTTLEYDVMPGDVLEKWLTDNQIAERDATIKANECINHYIKSLT